MALTIYLISILDSLIALGTISIILSTGVAFVIAIAHFASDGFNFPSKIVIILRRLGWIFITSILVTIFVPTSKTAAAMYLIPKIAANEDVQAIGENGLKALRELSGQWAEELVEEKNK